MVAKLRIKNLVKQQSLLCEEMFAAVRRDHRFYASLRHSIPQLIDSVDRICDQEQCAPHDLPKPSRDVYAWLTFLSDPDNLDHHEQTLKRLYRFTKTALRRSPQHGNTPIASLELVNCSALYRARILPQGSSLQLSEGFIAAEDDVLEAVIQSVFDKKTGPRKQKIRQFSLTEAFNEILMDLDLVVQVAAECAKGDHYDLDILFEQLQREYFSADFEKPRLMWSSICSTRKLGHYERSRDRVVLSPTLDRPEIPEYAVAFVLYHELLHKQHGAVWQNHKLMVHTPAFRHSEKQFRYYPEAIAVLNNLPDHQSL